MSATSRRQRFRALYDVHQEDIWKYCVRRSADVEAAEEVFNDTFVVVWKNFESVPAEESVRPWLFAVARNQLRNERRKSKRYTTLKTHIQRLGRMPVPADPTEMGSSNTEDIMTALGRLRERDVEILKLVAWDGLPYWEIGQVIGCSENTVASRVHRARKQLSKYLQELEDASTPVHKKNNDVKVCKTIDRSDLYQVTEAQRKGEAT